ncbi:ComEC/Rec2 family competence protein [Pedobacter miscanthi]|uniref:ComEC/Rec2 family competence protein n=1 Tax=Pedobacter miscanthi TaxID=2259170 RepID=UPI00292FBCFB|nr:ComEC/Rec2 family competence protein [Pedobacter miscanthi]
MFKAEYVFARILFPFILGIGIFYFFPSKAFLLFLSITLLLNFSCILTLNIIYKKLNAYRHKGTIGLLLFTFFFNLGGLFCLLNNETLKSDYFANKPNTSLKLLVKDEPQLSSNILRFKTRVISGYQKDKQIRLSGQLLVALRLDSLKPIQLKYGDEILISVKYTEIEPPYNPAEFDFKAWLSHQNIYHQTFIDQEHIIKTNHNVGNPIIKQALRLREKQVQKYRKLIKSNEAFAVASTLILGYRADLSKETLSAYSKTGTIHALSVSGAHVAIIYVVLDFLLMFLNRNRTLKIVKLISICSLIWGYALLTGLSPSVVRSAIMISILITAKVLSKNTNSYNILAFSALCQLIYDPFLIWDVGFQLSYLAVFGLIYLQPKIYNTVYIKNQWMDKLWGFIAMSLAAQIVTFPLSIYYFHQFPLYFLFGNLFISLPLVLMMYLGIAVLVPWLSFLAPIFEWLINFTNFVLKWIADLPYATFSSIWINLPEFTLLSFALGLFVYGLANFNKRFIFSSLLVFTCYQVLIAYNDINAYHQQKIIFFSLRKNYAAAFITGKESILVTDLKVTDKNYDFFIKPALNQLQVDSVCFVDLGQDTVLHNFVLKNHQLIFHDYKILIADKRLNYKKLQGNGIFSSLWISGNARFDLTDMAPEIKYRNMIIDATNRDYKIEILKKTAKNNRLDFHVLKKNKAYLVQLTQ